MLTSKPNPGSQTKVAGTYRYLTYFYSKYTTFYHLVIHNIQFAARIKNIRIHEIIYEMINDFILQFRQLIFPFNIKS